MNLSELEEKGLKNCIQEYYGCPSHMAILLTRLIMAAPSSVAGYSRTSVSVYRAEVRRLLREHDFPEDTMPHSKKGDHTIAIPLSTAQTILEDIKAEFGTPRELPLPVRPVASPTEEAQQTANDQQTD